MVYAQGSTVEGNDTSGFTEAALAAASADVTILVLGTDLSTEDEFGDRESLRYPVKKK